MVALYCRLSDRYCRLTQGSLRFKEAAREDRLTHGLMACVAK